jgi:WD40 repeat protein
MPYYSCVMELPKSKKLLCGGSRDVEVIDGKTLQKDITLGETSPFVAQYIQYNPQYDVFLTRSMSQVRFFELGKSSGQIKVNGYKVKDYGVIEWSPDGTKAGFYSPFGDVNNPRDTFGVFDVKNLSAPPRTIKYTGKLIALTAPLNWSPDNRTFYFNHLHMRLGVNADNLNTAYASVGRPKSGYQGEYIYSKDGKYVIVNDYVYEGSRATIGTEVSSLTCYEVATQRKVWETTTYKKLLKPISQVNNEIVALSQSDGTFYYFDLSNGQSKGSFAAGVNWQYKLANGLNPDGTQWAGVANNQIVICDLKNKTTTPLIAELPKGVSSLTFIRQDKYLAVTAGDNTVHIVDIAKKRDLAQIYLFANSNEWVVTTPEGRFDASQAAQEIMYYNKGGQVVPLSSLFEKFYTPKLLNRILDGETFDPVPVDVNTLKSPPTVTISVDNTSRNLVVEDDVASVTVQKDQINIRVQADCPSDAVTEIRLFQNGKLVQTTRNLVVEDDTIGEKSMIKTFSVALNDGENNFKALAFNTQRTESSPAELNVNYKAPKTSNAPTQNKPQNVQNTEGGIQLHLIVIGINKYKNPKHNLNYAIADATSFKEAIEKGGSTIFSKTNVVFINDENATKPTISAELEKIKTNASSKDVFIFYYAGHGVMNDKKEFYLVPHDVTQLYGADGALAQKGLSANQLQEYSKNIKAQKQLFILDACQSAAALENVVAARGAAEEKAIAQLARATGTHWLTASGSEQFASEFTQLGHGTFTYVLLEALSGKADTGDKKITVKEIDSYLQERVPEVTAKYKGTPQYPASYGYGNDFPIGVVKN